jgi:hypothetical protein
MVSADLVRSKRMIQRWAKEALMKVGCQRIHAQPTFDQRGRRCRRDQRE